MTLCPTCCQPLPAAPAIKVSLETNHAIARGHFVELQPDQAVVLFELLRTWPHSSTHDQIKSALWGKKATRPVDQNGIMRTQINRTRKAIGPLGYTIACVWSEGYRLIDQGRLVEMVAAE
jgi:DNA-binding response OmpR family regulator